MYEPSKQEMVIWVKPWKVSWPPTCISSTDVAVMNFAIDRAAKLKLLPIWFKQILRKPVSISQIYLDGRERSSVDLKCLQISTKTENFGSEKSKKLIRLPIILLMKFDNLHQLSFRDIVPILCLAI